MRLRPSHTTVRTGPYTAVREVTLTRFDQGRETERCEVGIGESHGEGFAPGEIPGSTAATRRVAQRPRDSQCDECRSPTPRCFPLAPEGGPQLQADPASESDQRLGRFAKAEIDAPAPHILGQIVHCPLDADALSPSRDVPDSLLKLFQRFRRNCAFDVRTSRKAEPEDPRRRDLGSYCSQRILALPGTDDSIRGLTVDSWIVADEAARLPNDLIAALRPMGARRPQARFAMLSTAWSRTDPFWTAWADDDPTWTRLKATADTTPFDADFLEHERRALGEPAFQREYLGIPTGAHTSPFSWELYERATQMHLPLVPPGPAFGPPVAARGAPVANPFQGLKQIGALR